MAEVAVQEFWWAAAADFLLDEEPPESDAEGEPTAETTVPGQLPPAVAISSAVSNAGKVAHSKASTQSTQEGGAGKVTLATEPEPPAVPAAYVVRPARPLETSLLQAVRLSYRSTVWELAGVRDGPKDSVEVLRPPVQICPPDGAVWESGRIRNPIAELGSCACPAERVRPAFVRFCLEHVRRALPCAGDGVEGRGGLVYVSLGSGELYHDWEVLERLLDEGYTLHSVHAVDVAYVRAAGSGGSAATNAAVRALAAWLAALGVTMCAYRELSELVAAANFKGADVLMQCDMDCADLELEPALRPGGLHLHLSQGEGKWFQAWQRPTSADKAVATSPAAAPDSSAASHARTDGLVLLEQRHGVLGTAPSEQLRYRTLEEMQEDADASDLDDTDAPLDSAEFDAALRAAQSAFVDIFAEETEGVPD